MESNELKICISTTQGREMLKILGSRGTVEILCALGSSSSQIRFGVLSKFLKHMSTKTLAFRLKKLEENGILSRTAYNEIPPRVEYSLTDKGEKLAEALKPLIYWIVQWSYT